MRVVTSLPVSRKTKFVLLTDGDYGPREVRNFLRMLELQLSLDAFGVDGPAVVDMPPEAYESDSARCADSAAGGHSE